MEPRPPSLDGPGTPARLPSLLPRTYGAFLGRFPAPTEVQVRAVPRVLEGRDVLLCAPTASGKTEAYAAPAVERLGARRGGGPALLLVSPTRALANDLKRRLEAPLDTLGVPFGRYTGEHKECVAGALPDVVVTTPEALDSLLARRPGVLAGVRTVVLDEIHVLDGTGRGDQLRFLLARLESAAQARPQRLAASATVEAPAELGARYLVDPVLVEAAGEREIRARFFAGVDTESVARHLDELARAGLRKVLVFCNRRRDVDRLAAGLLGRTPFGAQVFAHHGSLSQGVREASERRFLAAPAAVCCATLTLELGIDIGTVDYVLLVTPPPNVASLLQRLGRGGRRTQAARVGCAFADPAQELVFRVLLACAKERRLCAPPYTLRPGVLVQQALALAGGGGYVSAERLAACVPPELAAELGPGVLRELLDSMAEAGLLEPPRAGRFVLSSSEERLYDRGLRHSNFERPAGLALVDRLTGDVLGSLDPRQRPARTRMGGRSVRAVRELGGRLLVDAARGGEDPRYVSDAPPLVSSSFARQVACELGAGPGEWLQAPLDGAHVLLHGLGTLGGLALASCLRRSPAAGAVAEASPYTLRLARALPSLPAITPADLERFLEGHGHELARLCAMGPFHHLLPAALARAALRGALGVPALLAQISGARLVNVQPSTAELGIWHHL